MNATRHTSHPDFPASLRAHPRKPLDRFPGHRTRTSGAPVQMISNLHTGRLDRCRRFLEVVEMPARQVPNRRAAAAARPTTSRIKQAQTDVRPVEYEKN